MATPCPDCNGTGTHNDHQVLVECTSCWGAGHARTDVPNLIAEARRLRAERDEFADRIDTLTAVAKTNKLAHRLAVEECDRLAAELKQARQQTANVAAQRDRLRIRMNTLADRWDHALAVDKPYARTLRAEISVEPFQPTT